MAYYLGSSRDRQSRLAIVANDEGQITSPLPILLSQDALNPGQQRLELPPRPAPRARDYTFLQSFELPVFGELPYGQTLLNNLPPRAAARARDYSITESFPPVLIGADAVNPGAQAYALPPRGYQRASTLWEPGVNYTLALQADADSVVPIGQSTIENALPPRAAPRARDYSYADEYKPTLVGQDARNAGGQFTDLLPPRAAPRARDYTLTESYTLSLIGQDALNPGQQTYALPPKAYARGISLSDPGANYTLALQSAADAVIPPGITTLRTDNPPRAYSRARDYTFLDEYKYTLAGQDAVNPGEQTYDLPPRKAPRGISLSDPGQNYTLYISGDALPPGAQFTQLPPKRAERAKDYTNVDRLPNLIGQDTIYGAPGEVPVYDWPVPKGPQRARDYTWLQSAPLHIYQQLPPGDTTQLTELPPRGPQRMRDYTFLHLSDTRLIGLDVMFGAPGQVPTYDWQLPTPAPKRLRDYTFVNVPNLSEIIEPSFPGMHTLTVRPMFLHTLTVRSQFLHTLSVSAVPPRA